MAKQYLPGFGASLCRGQEAGVVLMETRALVPIDKEAIQIGALFVKAKGSMMDGLKYYIECGVKLKVIKDSLSHGQWLPWLKENEEILGFGIATAQRIIQVSNTALTRHYSDLEATNFLRSIWGNNHRALGTGENDWHTPMDYIDAAKKVMGEIDLDPASSKHAQKTVKANSFFTKATNGLSKRNQMAIAKYPPLKNGTNSFHIPPHWGSLY